MKILRVDARGRITLPKNDLQHLGIESGDEVEFELLSDGREVLMRAKVLKNNSHDSLGLRVDRIKETAAVNKALPKNSRA